MKGDDHREIEREKEENNNNETSEKYPVRVRLKHLHHLFSRMRFVLLVHCKRRDRIEHAAIVFKLEVCVDFSRWYC